AVAANFRFARSATAILRASLNSWAISPDGISWLMSDRSCSYRSWVSWSPVNWNPNLCGARGTTRGRRPSTRPAASCGAEDGSEYPCAGCCGIVASTRRAASEPSDQDADCDASRDDPGVDSAS